jgi:hypothetical protein
MRKSLLAYMQSEAFSPAVELDLDLVEELIARPRRAETVDSPEALETAALNVQLAAKLPQREVNTAWAAENDDVIIAGEGFAVALTGGGTWRDSFGSAWHGNPLSLAVRCPAGTEGSLYVLFHDWNGLGRRGVVTFEGERCVLGDHAGAGLWIRFDVTADHTSDGMLELSARPTAGTNIMISQVVLVPAGA